MASLTTEELVVKSDPNLADDVSFDYIVYGLRIGFEELSIVQEKTQEAYIPSMKDHRERYAKHPELRRYNALQRFGRMRADRGMTAVPDMNTAEALRDAIEEFDPEVHKLPHEKPESPLRPETPPEPDPGS